MSRRDSDSEKVPAALYDRLTDTPTYAARMYKVQAQSSLRLLNPSIATGQLDPVSGQIPRVPLFVERAICIIRFNGKKKVHRRRGAAGTSVTAYRSGIG